MVLLLTGFAGATVLAISRAPAPRPAWADRSGASPLRGIARATAARRIGQATAMPQNEPRPPALSTPAPRAHSTAPITAPQPAFLQTCGPTFCEHGSKVALYGASTLGGLDDPSGRLRLARAAHLNVVRIVNFLDEESPDPTTAPFDVSRWARVDREIATANDLGLRVILDLSTYRNLLRHEHRNPYIVDWDPFVRFVADRVNTVTGIRYRDDPSIAIISIAGEVEPLTTLIPMTPTTAQLTEFYARTIGELHRSDPHHLVSSGGLLQLDWPSGIDWRAIFALPGNDVPAIHVYSDRDEQVTLPAVAAETERLGKPWLLEEFGFPQTRGDAARAAAFRRTYDEAAAGHAAGTLFWDLGPELVGVGGKPDTYDVGPGTPATLAEVLAHAPPA